MSSAISEETMYHSISRTQIASSIAVLLLLNSTTTLGQTPEPPTDREGAPNPTGPVHDEVTPVASMGQTKSAPPSTSAARTNTHETPPAVHWAAKDSPPTKPTTRTDKLHDGFYLRLNLGFATQWTSIDSAATVPNYSAKGTTIAADLLIGGAPSPGLIFGGALQFESLPSSRFEADSRSAKTGILLGTIGPFFDGYPNSRGGFHSGGMLGFSAAHLTGNDYFAPDETYGFGLATWLGYDGWVADQWAVGGLLQFSGAHLAAHRDSSDLGVFARSVALLLTAVYQ
jgi:hypothetical protein